MTTKLISIATGEWLDKFNSRKELEAYCSEFGCDGFEAVLCGEDKKSLLHSGNLYGIHLIFYPCWVDLWNGDEKALLEEYGSYDVIKSIYGGLDRSAIIAAYKKELDYAKKIGVRYVVFHGAEAPLEQCITYNYRYCDDHIIKANLELINEILSDDYNFYFLIENLWRPGFSFTNPLKTAALLDGIAYEKKGIMLDIGHLMNTNLELANEQQACSYIHEMLDAHQGLCSYIKGIHLHQSITGHKVKGFISQNIEFKQDYFERFAQVYSYITQIDTHSPMTCPGTKELIERINPEFLTFELAKVANFESALLCQAAVFA